MLPLESRMSAKAVITHAALTTVHQNISDYEHSSRLKSG